MPDVCRLNSARHKDKTNGGRPAAIFHRQYVYPGARCQRLFSLVFTVPCNYDVSGWRKKKQIPPALRPFFLKRLSPLSLRDILPPKGAGRRSRLGGKSFFSFPPLDTPRPNKRGGAAQRPVPESLRGRVKAAPFLSLT